MTIYVLFTLLLYIYTNTSRIYCLILSNCKFYFHSSFDNDSTLNQVSTLIRLQICFQHWFDLKLSFDTNLSSNRNSIQIKLWFNFRVSYRVTFIIELVIWFSIIIRHRFDSELSFDTDFTFNRVPTVIRLQLSFNADSTRNWVSMLISLWIKFRHWFDSKMSFDTDSTLNWISTIIHHRIDIRYRSYRQSISKLRYRFKLESIFCFQH